MSVILLVLGVITALISDSIGTVFRLVIAIGTGPGVVLVLRWFWWRINAAAELAAMLCGFVVGFVTSVVPLLQIADYGQRLMVTTGLTAVVWLTVMLLTPPESRKCSSASCKPCVRLAPGGSSGVVAGMLKPLNRWRL